MEAPITSRGHFFSLRMNSYSPRIGFCLASYTPDYLGLLCARAPCGSGRVEMHTGTKLAWQGPLFLLLRASTFTHILPSGLCCFTLRPVHSQVHGYVSMSTPKQRQDNLEAVFAITKEARKYPLSLGLLGKDGKGLFHACCFPFANFPAQPGRQHRGALSPALLPGLSLPAGPSQQRPCSYCWGKQKTTAMRHQTGLHRVYAMTEARARLQRGRGSLRQLSPSTSKAVLWRPGGLKGPWRSLPPSLSFHQEARRWGVTWPTLSRVLRSALGNTGGRPKEEGAPLRFCLLPSSCPSCLLSCCL